MFGSGISQLCAMQN